MRKILLGATFLLMILSGCSSVKIIPEPVPAGVINQKDNSLTIAKNSTVITVGSAESDFVNYNIDTIVAAFHVEIQNLGDNEILFDNDGFLLVDSDNKQYYALTADKVLKMMAKDTYYLLPYPYVGFYYLEDYEKAAFKDSTNTNLPYYYEFYPQDIIAKSLPTGSVIPKARISGLVYFNVDLPSLKAFRLQIYKKGTSKSAEPDFVFPFKVVK